MQELDLLYANLRVLIVKPPKDYKQEEWYQMLGLSRLKTMLSMLLDLAGELVMCSCCKILW